MLLMKDAPPGPPPEEVDLTVPGAQAGAVRAVRGQFLTIENVRGGQVAALFGVCVADRREFLSPHHTRVFGGTFVLRLGTRLVTNRRRPMLVLGRDSLGRHDLLMPASPSCQAAVEEILDARGLPTARTLDPVHLFIDVALLREGRLGPGPCPAKPGDRVTFRVLIDATYVVAACATADRSWSADPPRDLRLLVHNDLLA
jgi:uncharacterized protein